MLRVSMEHLGNILKETSFKKSFNGKVVFVFKVYYFKMFAVKNLPEMMIFFQKVTYQYFMNY